MSTFQRVGLLLLLLLVLAGAGGAGLLIRERRQLLAQQGELQQQVDQLKDQVTSAAAIQEENRRLKQQVEELEQAASQPQPSPTSEQVPLAPSPTPQAASPSPTSEPQQSGSQLDPAQQALMDEIGQQVADLRGLAELSPVQRDVMTRDRLRTYLEQEIDKENTPEEFLHGQQELWLLGLAPRDLDLRQLLLDLQTEQIAGFYDPDTKQFYVISEQTELGPLDQITYAHEFDHHLQDQHFDLNKLLPDELEDDDRGLAIRALVEGDATLLMQDWLQQHLLPNLPPEELLRLAREQQEQQSPVFDAAPTYIRESLLFPYQYGQVFVQELHGSGGWELVNNALRDPPASTEQILHPEKYTVGQRDLPLEVRMPDLSGALPGWSAVDTNTLGEFDFSLMLSEHGAPSVQAEQAAAGWGGARYSLYHNPSDGTPLLVVATRWDSEEEAAEFERTLRSTLQAEDPLLRRDDVYVALARQGDRVSFAVGPDQGLVLRVSKVLP